MAEFDDRAEIQCGHTWMVSRAMLAVVPARGRPTPTAVYLEVGKRRVFACALDWPGWCRSGKDEELALDALAEAASRYAVVAAEAGIDFPASGFVVIERLPGNATTDFGAPDVIATQDTKRVTAKEGKRIAALVAASWAVLDRVVAHAPPELRKGPRGGGRDRDAIVEHVLRAEQAYAGKLGIRVRQRAAILDTLAKGSAGPAESKRGWPLRYAARRIAWHAIDHAWEIDDKSEAAS